MGRPGALKAISMDLKEMREKDAQHDMFGVWDRDEDADYTDESGTVAQVAARPGWGSTITCFEVRRVEQAFIEHATGEGFNSLADELSMQYAPYLLPREGVSHHTMPLPEIVKQGWRQLPCIDLTLELVAGANVMRSVRLNHAMLEEDWSTYNRFVTQREISAAETEGGASTTRQGGIRPLEPLFLGPFPLEATSSGGEPPAPGAAGGSNLGAAGGSVVAKGEYCVVLNYYKQSSGQAGMPDGPDGRFAGRLDVRLNGRLLAEEELSGGGKLPFTDYGQFRLLKPMTNLGTNANAELSKLIPPECFARMHGTLYVRGDFSLQNNKRRFQDGRGVQDEDLASRQLNKVLTARYEKHAGRRSGPPTPRATPSLTAPWNDATREQELKKNAALVGEWLVECHKHDEEVEFIWPSGNWGSEAIIVDESRGLYATKQIRLKGASYKAIADGEEESAGNVDRASATFLKLKIKQPGTAQPETVYAEALHFVFEAPGVTSREVSRLKEACQQATQGTLRYRRWTHQLEAEVEEVDICCIAGHVEKSNLKTHIKAENKKLAKLEAKEVRLEPMSTDTSAKYFDHVRHSTRRQDEAPEEELPFAEATKNGPRTPVAGPGWIRFKVYNGHKHTLTSSTLKLTVKAGASVTEVSADRKGDFDISLPLMKAGVTKVTATLTAGGPSIKNEFYVHVAGPLMAESFHVEEVADDKFDDGVEMRLGSVQSIKIVALDSAGDRFELAPTALSVVLERQARSREDGVVLEGIPTFAFGEAGGDGVRPILLSGLQLRGKVGAKGKDITLAFDAGPHAASRRFTAHLHVVPGVPTRLALKYNGSNTTHDDGLIADPSHIHVAGEELYQGEQLKEMELQVLDEDCNLTSADVRVYGGPNGVFWFGNDELGENGEEIASEGDPIKTIKMRTRNGFSVADPLDHTVDDAELCFGVVRADGAIAPTAKVHFVLIRPDTPPPTRPETPAPPERLEISIDGGLSDEQVRVGNSFYVKVRALYETGDEAEMLTSSIDELQLAWSPADVSHTEEEAWERNTDADGGSYVQKRVCLTCAESEVNVSLQLPQAWSGMGLEHVPKKINVLPGAAATIVVVGSAPQTVTNACELDEPLVVSLLDEFGAATDQPPYQTQTERQRPNKWMVAPKDGSVCVTEFNDQRTARASLQGRVLTAAVLRQEQEVKLVVSYGSLTKEVAVHVRPGPVPWRLVVNEVLNIEDGTMRDEAEDGVYNIPAADANSLPARAVRVQLEDGTLLPRTDKCKLVARLNEEIAQPVRETMTCADDRRCKILIGLQVPTTATAHEIKLDLDVSSGIADAKVRSLLGKVRSSVLPPAGFVPRRQSGAAEAAESRLHVKKTLKLHVVPAKPSVLRLEGTWPTSYISGEGWSGEDGAYVQLTDDFGNVIAEDMAAALCIVLKLETPSAPAESAGSSSNAVPAPLPALLVDECVGDAATTTIAMQDGRLEWGALKDALKLTPGGRTGGYTVTIHGENLDEQVADDDRIQPIGGFSFTYIDPAQTAHEERERMEIDRELPKKVADKSLKKALEKREKEFASCKSAFDAGEKDADAARKVLAVAKRELREKLELCGPNGIGMMWAHPPPTNQSLIPAAWHLRAICQAPEPTVALTLDDEGPQPYTRTELNDLVVDGMRLVVKPIQMGEADFEDSNPRRLGVYQTPQDGQGEEERRGSAVFELPSAADEELKSGTHPLGTLCRAAAVTDMRVSNLVLTLLGGDVALLGLGEGGVAAAPSAERRVRERFDGEASGEQLGAILAVENDDAQLDPRTGLVQIDGSVLPPAPSTPDAGDAAYLINLLNLDKGDESIRRALHRVVGKTVVLLSEAATREHLANFAFTHRTDVVLLGAHSSTAPFHAILGGVVKRLNRVDGTVCGSLRSLQLELPISTFTADGDEPPDEPDYALVQALTATRAGSNGLAVLHAKRAAREATISGSAAASQLERLEANLQTARRGVEHAKSLYDAHLAEINHLKKRKRELSGRRDHGDDDDEAGEGAAPPARRRRTR